MGHLQIRDDAIWARHIDGNSDLRKRILELGPEDTIELVVDGVVETWVKMKDGRDGRPTSGIRPVGAMRAVWKRMQARRDEVVPIREVKTADATLRALRPLLSEWDTPEDDEAFRDLPLR